MRGLPGTGRGVSRGGRGTLIGAYGACIQPYGYINVYYYGPVSRGGQDNGGGYIL